MTVESRQYYVYRYEMNLNDLGNAVVQISYSKEAFYNPKALRAFLCSDISMETQEIFDTYVER